MNSIHTSVKGLFNFSVQLLNQPTIKEGVKNVAGSLTFFFGLIEAHDFYKIARGRAISTEFSSTSRTWGQIANKVAIVSAKISLILSAGVSRPGVLVISSLVGYVFSTEKLECFGPNTIFAVNPWHPRHVISIATAILALPSAAQSTYKGINWMKGVCFRQNVHVRDIHPQKAHPWLTDRKIRLINLFNTITCRPTLHLGNKLSRFLLK